MPIRPFLAHQPFDPDAISEMSAALVRACDTLGLKAINDAATRLVAEKIIELWQRGVRSGEKLQAMIMKEFASK